MKKIRFCDRDTLEHFTPLRFINQYKGKLIQFENVLWYDNTVQITFRQKGKY